MATTIARAVANRENAKKSTGPRTADGKARSRANAVKHGLAGQGVAWPGEDEGAMEAFVAGQVELDRPQDGREAWLARRAAVAMWQVERGEAIEAMNAQILAAGAVEAELERRATELEGLVAMLGDSPARAMRGLLRTVEGCEWVLAALRGFAEAAESARWSDLLDGPLDILCRPPLPGLGRRSRVLALVEALATGDGTPLRPAGVPRPDRDLAEQKRDWQAELCETLLRRIAEVESLLESLRARPDPAMEYAALAASFDQSAEGERLRRYNRTNLRQREKSLRELAEWRASREEREAMPVEPVLIAAPPPSPSPAPPPPPSPVRVRSEALADGPVASPAGGEKSESPDRAGVAPDWLRSARRAEATWAGGVAGDPAWPVGRSGADPAGIRSA